MTATRRQFMASAGAAGLATLAPGALRAQEIEPILGDVILGSPDAPVTVIEYASYTCPHCAAFHRDTFPAIKEKYIDTGQVKFIMREVYFDRYGLWASMVARCGGERGFYPISEMFLKQQSSWARADDIAGEIRKIGRVNGLSTQQIDACLNDEDYARSLVERYQETSEADGVRSTPSFVIDGQLTSGNMGVEDFSRLLDNALSS
ncbi:MAG: DsbA family protein [Pseudomonadota bacterium]